MAFHLEVDALAQPVHAAVGHRDEEPVFGRRVLPFDLLERNDRSPLEPLRAAHEVARGRERDDLVLTIVS